MSRGPKAARRYAEALAKVDPTRKQEVLILREGFGGFQQRYRVSAESETTVGDGAEAGRRADILPRGRGKTRGGGVL